MIKWTIAEQISTRNPEVCLFVFFPRNALLGSLPVELLVNSSVVFIYTGALYSCLSAKPFRVRHHTYLMWFCNVVF